MTERPCSQTLDLCVARIASWPNGGMSSCSSTRPPSFALLLIELPSSTIQAKAWNWTAGTTSSSTFALSVPVQRHGLFSRASPVLYGSRTDIWALGCLLFAMWFGYSPFECSFVPGSATVKVVECSALRVLSPIPKPPTYATHAGDRLIYDLCVQILRKPIVERMFIQQVLQLIHNHLENGSSDLV